MVVRPSTQHRARDIDQRPHATPQWVWLPVTAGASTEYSCADLQTTPGRRFENAGFRIGILVAGRGGRLLAFAHSRMPPVRITSFQLEMCSACTSWQLTSTGYEGRVGLQGKLTVLCACTPSTVAGLLRISILMLLPCSKFSLVLKTAIVARHAEEQCGVLFDHLHGRVCMTMSS